jgi:LysR family hydrogen peroxide-inducible transcriptional activator
LQGAEDIVATARAAADAFFGSLCLGVFPTIGPFLLPQAMPALRRAFHRLNFHPKEEQTAGLLSQIEAGELDAAMLAFPCRTGDLATVTFAEDPFSLV